MTFVPPQDMAFELLTLKIGYQILGLFIIDLFPALSTNEKVTKPI